MDGTGSVTSRLGFGESIDVQTQEYMATALSSVKHLGHREFDLSDRGNIRGPNSTQVRWFFTLFPSTHTIEFRSPLVIIRVHTLPPRPWPITVAGAAIYITTDEYDEGFHHGRFGKGSKLFDNLDFTENRRPHSLMELSTKVFEWFRSQRIELRSVNYLHQFYQLELAKLHDLKMLPSRIGRLMVEYVEHDSLPKQELNRRIIDSAADHAVQLSQTAQPTIDLDKEESMLQGQLLPSPWSGKGGLCHMGFKDSLEGDDESDVSERLQRMLIAFTGNGQPTPEPKSIGAAEVREDGTALSSMYWYMADNNGWAYGASAPHQRATE
ncbi:MAG: hypothetical protein M1828_005724 [Chrysothrix sp. TS-e1954]|nr:MAG: hypothetical protein M1828_005724 [Chrysothrix sp. TS-e1954]